MDILKPQEIYIKEGINSSGEYELNITGMRISTPWYMVRKADRWYLILDRYEGILGKKESEEEARAFAYKRALGRIDVFIGTYNGERKP